MRVSDRVLSMPEWQILVDGFRFYATLSKPHVGGIPSPRSQEVEYENGF